MASLSYMIFQSNNGGKTPTQSVRSNNDKESNNNNDNDDNNNNSNAHNGESTKGTKNNNNTETTATTTTTTTRVAPVARGRHNTNNFVKPSRPPANLRESTATVETLNISNASVSNDNDNDDNHGVPASIASVSASAAASEAVSMGSASTTKLQNNNNNNDNSKTTPQKKKQPKNQHQNQRGRNPKRPDAQQQQQQQSQPKMTPPSNSNNNVPTRKLSPRRPDGDTGAGASTRRITSPKRDTTKTQTSTSHHSLQQQRYEQKMKMQMSMSSNPRTLSPRRPDGADADESTDDRAMSPKRAPKNKPLPTPYQGQMNQIPGPTTARTKSPKKPTTKSTRNKNKRPNTAPKKPTADDEDTDMMPPMPIKKSPPPPTTTTTGIAQLPDSPAPTPPVLAPSETIGSTTSQSSQASNIYTVFRKKSLLRHRDKSNNNFDWHLPVAKPTNRGASLSYVPRPEIPNLKSLFHDTGITKLIESIPEDRPAATKATSSAEKLNKKKSVDLDDFRDDFSALWSAIGDGHESEEDDEEEPQDESAAKRDSDLTPDSLLRMTMQELLHMEERQLNEKANRKGMECTCQYIGGVLQFSTTPCPYHTWSIDDESTVFESVSVDQTPQLNIPGMDYNTPDDPETQSHVESMDTIGSLPSTVPKHHHHHQQQQPRQLRKFGSINSVMSEVTLPWDMVYTDNPAGSTSPSKKQEDKAWANVMRFSPTQNKSPNNHQDDSPMSKPVRKLSPLDNHTNQNAHDISFLPPLSEETSEQSKDFVAGPAQFPYRAPPTPNRDRIDQMLQRDHSPMRRKIDLQKASSKLPAPPKLDSLSSAESSNTNSIRAATRKNTSTRPALGPYHNYSDDDDDHFPSPTPESQYLLSRTLTPKSVPIRRVKHYPRKLHYKSRRPGDASYTLSGWYSGPLVRCDFLSFHADNDHLDNDQEVMHGNGIFWFTTGDLYMGEFYHNELHGIGALSILKPNKEFDICKGLFQHNDYVGPVENTVSSK